MSESNSGYDKILNSATSVFEKAIEFKFFNILISFTLLLDVCLIKFFNKNITNAFSGDDPISLNVAHALLFFCIFSFFMSVFFKAARQCLLYLLSFVFQSKIAEPFSINGIYRGDIHLSETKAIAERDSFTLELINKRRAEIETMQSQLDISFSMCCIILYNYYFSSSTTTDSVLNIATTYISSIDFISSNIAFVVLTQLAKFSFIGMTLIMLLLSINGNMDNNVSIPNNEKL